VLTLINFLWLPLALRKQATKAAYGARVPCPEVLCLFLGGLPLFDDAFGDQSNKRSMSAYVCLEVAASLGL